VEMQEIISCLLKHHEGWKKELANKRLTAPKLETDGDRELASNAFLTQTAVT